MRPSPLLEITRKEVPEGWLFGVVVRDESNGTESRHSVSLSKKDGLRLCGGSEIPPEELVRRAFVFLLEREPKESILRVFDLTVISRYFPEFEAAILRSLNAGEPPSP